MDAPARSAPRRSNAESTPSRPGSSASGDTALQQTTPSAIGLQAARRPHALRLALGGRAAPQATRATRQASRLVAHLDGGHHAALIVTRFMAAGEDHLVGFAEGVVERLGVPGIDADTGTGVMVHLLAPRHLGLELGLRRLVTDQELV